MLVLKLRIKDYKLYLFYYPENLVIENYPITTYKR